MPHTLAKDGPPTHQRFPMLPVYIEDLIPALAAAHFEVTRLPSSSEHVWSVRDTVTGEIRTHADGSKIYFMMKSWLPRGREQECLRGHRVRFLHAQGKTVAETADAMGLSWKAVSIVRHRLRLLRHEPKGSMKAWFAAQPLPLPARRAAVAAMIEDGLPHRQIADVLNIPVGTVEGDIVANRKNRMRIPKPIAIKVVKPKRMPSLAKAEAERLLAEGMKPAEIARRVGLSCQRVCQIRTKMRASQQPQGFTLPGSQIMDVSN